MAAPQPERDTMNIDDKKRIEELEKELEGKPVCISWDGFIDRKGAAYQDKDDSWSFEFYKGSTFNARI